MKVIIWNIISILSLLICIASIVMLCVRKYLRNFYYHDFQKNELIKNTDTINSKNALYFTNGETIKYIDRYVLCKTMYDKYIICNYVKAYKKISFYVFCYNKKGNVLSVLKFAEENTKNASRIIAVHKDTIYVNVVISKVDGVAINNRIIRPLSNQKIMYFSLFFSLSVFTGLFSIRQLMILMINSYQVQYVLGSAYNYISVVLALVIGLCSFVITSSRLRKKNIKALSGGVNEYEFF